MGERYNLVVCCVVCFARGPEDVYGDKAENSDFPQHCVVSNMNIEDLKHGDRLIQVKPLPCDFQDTFVQEICTVDGNGRTAKLRYAYPYRSAFHMTNEQFNECFNRAGDTHRA